MVFRKTDAGIYSGQLAAGIDFPAMFWISYSTHRRAKQLGPWLDHSPLLKSDLSPFPGAQSENGSPVSYSLEEASHSLGESSVGERRRNRERLLSRSRVYSGERTAPMES